VAEVNAALPGESNTSLVTGGTSVYEKCTYNGGTEIANTEIEISVGYSSEFIAGEHNVGSMTGETVVTLAGLGDEAYAVQGTGMVSVLKGSLQVEILAEQATTAQAEALAREII
jgi:hypothetical protein